MSFPAFSRKKEIGWRRPPPRRRRGKVSVTYVSMSVAEVLPVGCPAFGGGVGVAVAAAPAPAGLLFRQGREGDDGVLRARRSMKEWWPRK